MVFMWSQGFVGAGGQLWLGQEQPLSLSRAGISFSLNTKSLTPSVLAETTEEFYVLKEEMLGRLEELKDRKEQLLSSEPVRAQLHRQPTLFRPSAAAARFELPHDFFNLTAEELRREQRLR